MKADEQEYEIRTEVARNADYSDVLEIEVSARTGDGIDSIKARLSATLIPDLIFEAFDMTGDLINAYELLTIGASKINKTNIAAGIHGDLEADLFLIIDRLNVDDQARGNHLGLRLMREAVSLFGNEFTQVLVQAAPQGEDMSKEKVQGLMNYYKSDQYLKLKEVDSENYLGWLITVGEEDYSLEGRYFP